MIRIAHDVRRLQAIPGEELAAYIDNCMHRAVRESRQAYLSDLRGILEAQASDIMPGGQLRILMPLPSNYRDLGPEAGPVKVVNLSADHLRAVSHYLAGARP